MEDNIDILKEGIHDKYLFKAILMAGGPGSGKSTVVKEFVDVYEPSGVYFKDSESIPFKYGFPTYKISNENVALINSDDIFEILLSRNGLPQEMSSDPETELYQRQQGLRNDAKRLIAKKQQYYINGMLPLVIDGTGRDFERTTDIAYMLEKEGYDVYMIFVDTTLETSQKRNQKRVRKVAPDVVESIWNAVQENRKKYEVYFGERFYYVDNNDKTPEAFAAAKRDFQRKGRKILNSPLENPIGKKKLNAIPH